MEKMTVKPLGTLAPTDRATPWSAQRLDRSREMPSDVRVRVLDYLTGCPVFLAWMEVTRDEIGGQFEVAGGSAIASDGVYYWRLDGIEYIREYGIPVPHDAVAYFEARKWIVPTIERAEYIQIYRELDELFGGGEVVG
ncbi:hypothetical protein AB1046_01545 [Promicromonospora sp. Populi]|uniref:hypothetical protein n=1 Tax=Promicromonospora sp. Populi TaxID=3239420 RepID=UPI0034E1A84A